MHIINSCIDENVFPQAWKTARISPVPKSDNPTESKDYRPVSILPILSKVYERLVLCQIQDFIVKFSLYEETQSGFRKWRGTGERELGRMRAGDGREAGGDRSGCWSHARAGGRIRMTDIKFFNDFLVPFLSKLTKIRTKEY